MGNHSLSLPLDIGVGHPSLANFETDPNIAAALAKVDPAGQCADLNRVKGPILRGLAARAPCFHNGAVASLRQVVDFYDKRFNMQLSDGQKADLSAFLGSL